MKSTSGGSTSAASMMAVLMPHTSVTRLPGLNWFLYSSRNRVMPLGWRHRMVTSDWGMTSPASAVTRSPTLCSAAKRRVGSDTSTPTISKSSKPFSARAMEPPIKPRPMTAMVFDMKKTSFYTLRPTQAAIPPILPIRSLN